jgi:hypothetical protein
MGTRRESSCRVYPVYITPSGSVPLTSRPAEMSVLLARFRRFYGSHPLHLLTMVAGFSLAGYILFTFNPKALWNPHAWWQSIAVWLVAAVIFHDFALFPLYALADRLLGIAAMRQRRRRRGQLRVPGRNHVRIPTLASGLTLLMFWPGIVKQGSATYSAATGQNSAAVPRPLAVAHRGSVQRQHLWLRGPTCAGSPSCPRRHQPAGPRQRSTGRHPPTAAPLDAAERRRNCPRALPTTGKTKTAPTLCSCRPQTNFGVNG